LQENSEVENWKLGRKLISKVGVFLTQLITSVRDPLSGYFFFKKDVIKDTKLKTIGYKILFEILVKGNYKKVNEIGFKFRDRKFSQIKIKFKRVYIVYGANS